MEFSAMTHPTWIEIDLSAVRANCARIIQDTRTPLMAIVKGNAYGHGAVEVARAAIQGGAQWLGVARYCEAQALREAGINVPILVLGLVTAEEVDQAICTDVTLTLHSPESLALFAARARSIGNPVHVHVKIETGMGRLGFFVEDVVPHVRQALAENILIDGVFSHLASAEEPGSLTELQTRRFQSALTNLEEAGLRPRWAHLANSAAAFYLPPTRFDLVRVGNVVLGLRIQIHQPLPEGYRPALTWKARLASCRRLPAGWGVGYGQAYTTDGDEFIGVVPVGYGDGLRRIPGNQVIIGGEKRLVVGKLCLDQLMTRLPSSYPMGEEVVLIGNQGKSSIWVHDVADLYQTSQVDFTTLIHQRVPRIYV